MFSLDSKGLVELAKSFGRFIYFGLLGLVGAFLTSLLTSGQLNNETVTIVGITVNVGVVLVAGIGLVIKAIDRYRHESESNNSAGLAPSFLQK